MSWVFFGKETIKFENNSLKLSLAGILVFIDILYALLLFLVVYPSDILNIIEISTLGIINSTFIVYIPLNVLNILFFLVIANMSFHELGLSWKNLWQGILIVAGIWLFSELIILFIDLGSGITPIISSHWSNEGVAYTTIGYFIHEFLGNSLFEEVLFRGVLIPQMFIFFKRKEIFKKEAVNWFICVLITQTVFALIHLPNRIINGYRGLDLVLNLFLLLGIGAIFATIFLNTRNLVVAIGVHALNNIGLALFTHIPTAPLIFLGTALIISFVYLAIRYVIRQKEKQADITPTENDLEKNSLEKSKEDRIEEKSSSNNYNLI